MAADHVGQQFGNYRLLQRLGEGGFAEVYLGEHIYLKTQAAIKILHTRLAADDTDSFVSEARIIARLKHPHIVRVLDFGVESGTPFLVMDYAPNGTLRQRHPKSSILASAAILPYVKQVAEALHYAHEHKLVHRDIKPENMLIGERDEVLLSDFGIATVAQSSRYQGTQEVAGTVAYMAPEQVQGKPRPASDQYALGIVIYEWLTGERPFHGSFTEIATQHVLAPPTPLREKLPGIPPMLETVVMTTLAKDPKERFANIQAFANAFEQACHAASPQPAPAWQSQPPDVATRAARTSEPAFFSVPTHITPSQQAASTIQPPSVNPPPAIQATPPGWKDVAGPAPAGQTDTFGGMPSALPPTIQAATPPQKGRHPRRRPSQRLIVIASLVLLLVVAAGTLWQVIQFHQEVKIGPHITNISVGTGVNTSSNSLEGETDTFKVGDSAYILFSATSDVQLTNLQVYVIRSTNERVLYQVNLTHAANLFYAGPASITATGVYKWEVYYNGTLEASITFQAVS
jgi:serine/threonine protein kinase